MILKVFLVYSGIVSKVSTKFENSPTPMVQMEPGAMEDNTCTELSSITMRLLAILKTKEAFASMRSTEMLSSTAGSSPA